MTFRLSGFLILAREHPHFGLPLFKSTSDENVYYQSIGKDGLIQSFQLVAKEEREHLSDINDFGHEGELKVGDVGHYAFFISESDSFFGDRPSVEDYIYENMSTISNSAIAELQALRFIGCSRSDELVALDKFSKIFNNSDVRTRFLEVERSMIPISESEEEIDRLIDRLFNSPNFATTHETISNLQEYEFDFLPRHFKMAMRACLSNNQVYWISEDLDVRSFIELLIEKGKLKLTAHAKSKLGEVFSDGPFL